MTYQPLQSEDATLKSGQVGALPEARIDQDELAALMAMSEAEIDAELRALGIDPEIAAQKGAEAVASARSQAGYVCAICGKNSPHQHTPEDVVIFRNGVKRGRAAAPSASAPPGWQPQFDAVSVKQEELLLQFCFEIAGPRGKPGLPPDPVRLLEMAQALYEAERESFASPGEPQQMKSEVPT